jgi:hypothetical protein
MALMFDVRPTCSYRHLGERYTRQFAIADRGNVIIKVVMRKKGCPNYREFRIIDVSLYSEFVGLMINSSYGTPHSYKNQRSRKYHKYCFVLHYINSNSRQDWTRNYFTYMAY